MIESRLVRQADHKMEWNQCRPSTGEKQCSCILEEREEESSWLVQRKVWQVVKDANQWLRDSIVSKSNWS